MAHAVSSISPIRGPVRRNTSSSICRLPIQCCPPWLCSATLTSYRSASRSAAAKVSHDAGGMMSPLITDRPAFCAKRKEPSASLASPLMALTPQLTSSTPAAR